MDRLRMLWVLMLIAVLSLPESMAFPLSPQNRLRHIITVGEDPGDGDYTSIKEALNHSSPGDIIEVYSGTYYEHGISITVEGVSLIGLTYDPGDMNHTGKPFIDGQGLDDVIGIYSSNVTVSGFQIENNGGPADQWNIIFIQPHANNCIISNNTLISSSECILVCCSSYSKITNNYISNAGSHVGIGLTQPGGHNVASDNIIERCPIGIEIGGGVDDTVVGNLITHCSKGGSIAGGWSNVYQYNTFENNSAGLSLDETTFNVIKDNNFLNNSNQAYFTEGLWASTNRWNHNYWDRPRLLPYPIQGSNFIFPWVQFDWRPALLPNKIPS